VLQAGGMAEIDGTLKQKEQREPVKNEATNGLSNKRGTLSMARTSAINSGTSHFFINLVDNTRLDHRGIDPANYGYAVFIIMVGRLLFFDTTVDIRGFHPVFNERFLAFIVGITAMYLAAYFLWRYREEGRPRTSTLREREGPGRRRSCL